ncbi:hypothetical protein [Sphingomonas cavernae]|uniref:Uncharacterized protein n=1 Tax=Sphingomonas cavernae TaxID=2320861 RepID=A0A418WL07_9SPHN|nr:hypothetical protein [Sphingomonas cavernae]RJF90695.1 hypothetical protein D3876_10830 [Sphingomonas cavernae]
MRDAHDILSRRLRAYFDAHGLALLLCSSRSERWASATFSGARHQFGFAIEDATDDMRDRLSRAGAALGEADMPLPGHILADIGFVPSGGTPGCFEIEALTVEAA